MPFPLFSQGNAKHHFLFLLCDFGVGATDRERRAATVMYTLFLRGKHRDTNEACCDTNWFGDRGRGGGSNLVMGLI